jgi:hypothetical protein
VGDLGYGTAVILAAVFAAAALAKARRPAATARSLADFGVPRPALVARGLPVVEAALAVALLVVPAPAAWAALATLLVFSAVLGAGRRRGVTTPCACLGGGAGEEVPSPSAELLRNGILAAGAVVATGAGSPAWPGLPVVVTATAAAAVAAVAVAAVRLRDVTGFLVRVPWPDAGPSERAARGRR